MKKKAAWVTIFCCFRLFGIVVGSVGAQEGQEDGLSDFSNFGALQGGCRSREEGA